VLGMFYADPSNMKKLAFSRTTIASAKNVW
jgi:hypothetical protein